MKKIKIAENIDMFTMNVSDILLKEFGILLMGNLEFLCGKVIKQLLLMAL